MYRYFDSSATLAVASLVFASKLNNYFFHITFFIVYNTRATFIQVLFIGGVYITQTLYRLAFANKFYPFKLND